MSNIFETLETSTRREWVTRKRRKQTAHLENLLQSPNRPQHVLAQHTPLLPRQRLPMLVLPPRRVRLGDPPSLGVLCCFRRGVKVDVEETGAEVDAGLDMVDVAAGKRWENRGSATNSSRRGKRHGRRRRKERRDALMQDELDGVIVHPRDELLPLQSERIGAEQHRDPVQTPKHGSAGCASSTLEVHRRLLTRFDGREDEVEEEESTGLNRDG